MTLRKRILLAGGAVALLAALALAFRPQPERVETAVAERGPLQATIKAEGVARVEERYVVAAPVSGFAHRIPYDVGDFVRAGAVLVELSPAPPHPLDARARAELAARVQAAAAVVRRAEAEAAAARAPADLAAATLARMQPLAADSVLAPAELDLYVAQARQTAAARASAEAAVEAARQEHRAARALLQAGSGTAGERVAPVRAPAAGAVLAVHHESEGVVVAGQPLVELGDPEALEVAADVLSEEAARLTPGMPVLVEAGDGTAEGRVREVEPVAFTEVSALGVEEQRVLVLVDLAPLTERPLRLGHGYRVRVQFVVWESADALRVPTSALFEHDDGWAVFVSSRNRAYVRTVEVGHRAGLWVEVLGGLEAGERVITHPGDGLSDGARVATD